MEKWKFMAENENQPQELNDQQRLAILNEWNNRPSNPPSLLELVRVAFPDAEGADGRSWHGKKVKEFLSTRQIKARASYEYLAKDKIELSPEQKEFAANNAGSMGALEITKSVFNNQNLTSLSQETRTIIEFIKTLDQKVIQAGPVSHRDTESIADSQYMPPKTFERMLFRINRYVHEGIDKDKVTSRQKAAINAIIGYMHTYRFLHQINSYTSNIDRELFESSFVRYTFDKPDLTQEEVDQYIVLATEVVISANIQETIQTLQNQIDMEVDGGGKIPMALIEAISGARNEYNQSTIRQQKLLNDLKVKRSDRLSKQIKENASILNLVQMWKEEDSRTKLLKLAERRKAMVKNEIDRLSTMDEIKCRILGISEDEVLNG